MIELTFQEKWAKFPMLRPIIGKVVVNVSVGSSGEAFERAVKILKQVTGRQPCKREAKKTIKQFGIQKGEPIACMVTFRREEAVEFLKKAFKAVGNRLKLSCFDERGNFSFGIKEHLNFPDVKYDPSLGVIGMDVCVTIERRGWRVARRRVRRRKIGSHHLLSKEEVVEFIRSNFGVEII